MRQRRSGLVYKNNPWNRLKQEGACLIFPNKGRGAARSNGKMVYATRLVWEFFNGSIPDGLKVLHTCDNDRCVYITHLFLGTQADNIRDMDRKGRRDPINGYAHNPKLSWQDVRDTR